MTDDELRKLLREQWPTGVRQWHPWGFQGDAIRPLTPEEGQRNFAALARALGEHEDDEL